MRCLGVFCIFVLTSVAYATHTDEEPKARAKAEGKAFAWTEIGTVAVIRSARDIDELPDSVPKDQKKIEKELYERTLPHLRVDGKSPKLVSAQYIGAGPRGLSGRTERVIVTVSSVRDGGTTEWVATYVRQPDRELPRGAREQVWQVNVRFRQVPE